jgi:hypothetical protein
MQIVGKTSEPGAQHAPAIEETHATDRAARDAPDVNLNGAFRGAMLVICAFMVLKLTLPEFIPGCASYSWPSTKGTIRRFVMRQKQEKRFINHVATAEYTYEVDGIAYEGDRIQAGEISAADRSRVTWVEDWLKPGTEVEVYYNPSEPKRAFLVRGPEWRIAGGVVFGGIAMLVGVYWLRPLLSYWRRRA